MKRLLTLMLLTSLCVCLSAQVSLVQHSVPGVPKRLNAHNGNLFFFRHSSHDLGPLELWKSDGSPQGTQLVQSFALRDYAIDIEMVSTGKKLAFIFDNELYQQSAWVSDGGPSGTQAFFPSSQAAKVTALDWLTPFNDKVSFLYHDQLYISDLTPSGTQVVDQYPEGGTEFMGFQALGNDLLYIASFIDYQQKGLPPFIELRKTQGQGTTRLAAFDPGEDPFYTRLLAATVWKGKYYFALGSLQDIQGSRVGLSHVWCSDGTAEGTQLVKDLGEGWVSNLIAADNRLFIISKGEYGSTLYRSNGTTDGTQSVKTFWSHYLEEPCASGQKVFFSVTGEESIQSEIGRELWVSDGTSGGTYLVKDINPQGSSQPQQLQAFHDKLFFSADDGEHGRELWCSDGTAEGTQLVADLRIGSDHSYPQALTPVGNTLFFTAIYQNRYELWKYELPAESQAQVTQFTLIDATTDKAITSLTEGQTLNLNTLAGPINIQAVTNPKTVASVKFSLSGASPRVENVYPYALRGDHKGDYHPWNPKPGQYTLTATPYSKSGATGEAGQGLSISFTVMKTAEEEPTGPAIESFSLINANTDQVIQSLEEGATYSPDIPLNVRANVSNASIKSVVFYLNGNKFRTENAAPYALRGDSNGDYYPWNPKTGTYTLKAIPFSAKNGQGNAGKALKVTFTITNTSKRKYIGKRSPAPYTDLDIQLYPNPNSGNVRVEFSGLRETSVPLEIFNPKGQLVLKQVFQGASTLLDLQQLPGGVYLLRFQHAGITYHKKMSKLD